MKLKDGSILLQFDDLELLERVWMTFYSKDHDVIKTVFIQDDKYSVIIKERSKE